MIWYQDDLSREVSGYGNGRYWITYNGEISQLARQTMIIEAAKVNGESHSTERCHFGSKKYHHHYT
jgi:hypothetical protein